MSKTKQFFQLFFILLGIISFFALLGTAGASDFRGMEIGQLLVRGVGAVGLLVFCRIGHAVASRKERE